MLLSTIVVFRLAGSPQAVAPASCAAWEIASSLRSKINGYVPEPLQHDSWSSLEFPNQGQTVRCVISQQDENDYAVTLACTQGLMRSLLGGRPPALDSKNINLVREALTENPRVMMLSPRVVGRQAILDYAATSHQGRLAD